MLTARTDDEAYVEAAAAVRGGAYRCRGCGAPVALKAGQVRIAHFAHRPDATCAFGARMSLAHLEAQNRIAQSLRERGVEAELEAVLPSPAGDRRIDVLAWPAARPTVRVAIEVQASDLTPELIAARTRSYDAEGIAPLWLRLIDFGRFAQVQTLPFRATVWIETYRARAWERWAHDQLCGRLWFLDAGTFHAWRGTFIQAHSYRQGATWYADGDERSAGGDWREISQWVELELDGPFALADLRLGRGLVAGADQRRRLASWFVPPGEPAAAPTQPLVRAQLKRGQGGVQRELQVRIDGRWIPTTTDGARADWRIARPERTPVVRP